MTQRIACVLLFAVFFVFNQSVLGETSSDTSVKETNDTVEQEKSDVFDVDKFMKETQKRIDALDLGVIKEKMKNKETGHYSLEKYLDTMEELMDDLSPGRSPMSIARIPKGNYFKHVTFRCPGDFQATGVYFSERDINGINGDQYEWDTFLGKEVSTMSKKIESYFYHYLTFRPRFEFANGLVTLHTEFQHGGYMWEMAYADYHFEDEVIWGSMSLEDQDLQRTSVDTRQLSLTGLALEMVSPFGFLMIGPTGIVYGAPLPPVAGITGGFALYYGKVSEGMIWNDDRKGSENFGWDYREVQNGDGFMDKNDLTVYGLVGGGMTKALGANVGLGGGLAKVIGGDESRIFSGIDLNIVMGGLTYKKGDLNVNTITGSLFGTLMDNGPGTYFGDLGETAAKLTDQMMMIMDFANEKYYPPVLEFPKTVKQDPVWLFATQVNLERGNFTPEACFIYTQGTEDGWSMPMVVPGFLQSVGNKTPQGWLKSYLLNEVEKKYLTLIGTIPLSMIGQFGDVSISATNMTAVKAGTAYRISKHFEIYGQAIAAWRSNIDYYKEAYWEDFVSKKAFGDMKMYNDDFNYRRMKMPILFQLLDTDYTETDVDNFLGTELDTKFTYHMREGLDVSLIAAYFQPGGFYEDILTPKKYAMMYGTISDVYGDLTFAEVGVVDLYGPYEGSMEFFKLTNAFTVQIMFDLKWE